MTKSELHAIMTGGYATIAGAVMATYMGLGVSPKDLLTASIMNAPTALAISKLMYPETEMSQTASGNIVIPKRFDQMFVFTISDVTYISY